MGRNKKRLLAGAAVAAMVTYASGVATANPTWASTRPSETVHRATLLHVVPASLPAGGARTHPRDYVPDPGPASLPPDPDYCVVGPRRFDCKAQWVQDKGRGFWPIYADAPVAEVHSASWMAQELFTFGQGTNTTVENATSTDGGLTFSAGDIVQAGFTTTSSHESSVTAQSSVFNTVPVPLPTTPGGYLARVVRARVYYVLFRLWAQRPFCARSPQGYADWNHCRLVWQRVSVPGMVNTKLLFAGWTGRVAVDQRDYYHLARFDNPTAQSDPSISIHNTPMVAGGKWETVFESTRTYTFRTSNGVSLHVGFKAENGDLPFAQGGGDISLVESAASTTGHTNVSKVFIQARSGGCLYGLDSARSYTTPGSATILAVGGMGRCS